MTLVLREKGPRGLVPQTPIVSNSKVDRDTDSGPPAGSRKTIRVAQTVRDRRYVTVQQATVQKIVSGGQTGVDRAALDAAIHLNLPHGGWCPKGRRAEDGTLPAKYRLQETRATQYAVRTRWNVRDSDGTLILSPLPLTGGTALTAEVARSLNKPVLIVEPDSTRQIEAVRRWITSHAIQVLNVAGPRESTVPGIYRTALTFLQQLLRNITAPPDTAPTDRIPHDAASPGTGARRMADISPDHLARLNRGEVETRTLSECLAIDYVRLMNSVAPDVPLDDAAAAALARPNGITRRVQAAGQLLLQHYGDDPEAIRRFAEHPSDTVRGWAAYMIAAIPDVSLARRLQQIRPLADDPHFGVREWAWLAMRTHVASDIEASVAQLERWPHSRSENLRRFAVEATRPRGVWCAHLMELKQSPQIGLPLLEPLKADPSKYVQDSVANWLNDASKSQPEWVQDLCRRWGAESACRATARICHRALRSLRKSKTD